MAAPSKSTTIPAAAKTGIIDRLDALGLSQGHVAAAWDTHASTICRWLDSDGDLTLTRAVQLAAVLDLTVDALAALLEIDAPLVAPPQHQEMPTAFRPYWRETAAGADTIIEVRARLTSPAAKRASATLHLTIVEDGL